MNGRHDPLEQRIRSALNDEIDPVVRALDRRMDARRPFEAIENHTPSIGWRVWRPAWALAVLLLALGAGYWWGEQRSATVRFAAVSSSVVDDSTPALVALYRSDNAIDLETYGLSQPPAEAEEGVTSPQAAVSLDDVQKSESDEGVAAGSAPSEFSTQAQVTQLKTGRTRSTSRALLSPNVSSVALLGDDLVFAREQDVLRLSVTGERRPLASGLQQPSGVAVDAAGRVFVSERVPNGALILLDKEGEKTTIKSGLVYPAGIAFAPDRSLYLAEQGRDRILRFVPDRGVISPQSRVEVVVPNLSTLSGTKTLDDDLGLDGPFALTVTPENVLLVSDRVAGQSVIYRFSLNKPTPWWSWLWPKPNNP